MSGDSGWNAVIHHPSDLELQNWNWEENDGEQEKELPSTVDMDAIKGGGSWDPATEPNGTRRSHCIAECINLVNCIHTHQ